MTVKEVVETAVGIVVLLGGGGAGALHLRKTWISQWVSAVLPRVVLEARAAVREVLFFVSPAFHRCAFADPAEAVSSAVVSLVEVGVAAVIRVPLGTVGLGAADQREFSSGNVFLLRDDFEVPGVDTRPSAAQVIELLSRRNFASVQDERCVMCSENAPAEFEVPIALLLVDRPRPQPAPGFWYLRDESFQPFKGSAVVRHEVQATAGGLS